MKVSVIIPYNKDRGFLKEARASIFKQTYTNYEIIEIYSPKRVGANINKGISLATGDLIRYLSEDDKLHENSLKGTVEYFLANPDIDFIHGNAMAFYNDPGLGTSIHKPEKKIFTSNELARKNYIHGGTAVYTSNCFKKFGLFDESLWTGEEFEFNLRILSQGAKIGYLDKILYLYRRHSNQKSTGNKDKEYQTKRKEAIDKIRNKYR